MKFCNIFHHLREFKAQAVNMSEEFMREENNGGKSGQGEADKYFRLIAENLTDMITPVDITGRRLYC